MVTEKILLCRCVPCSPLYKMTLHSSSVLGEDWRQLQTNPTVILFPSPFAGVSTESVISSCRHWLLVLHFSAGSKCQGIFFSSVKCWVFLSQAKPGALCLVVLCINPSHLYHFWDLTKLFFTSRTVTMNGAQKMESLHYRK